MNNSISIYIHWPFCLAKCPYCDFNSHIAEVTDHKLWLKSYELELEHFAEIISNKYVKSIFFGGGTPSLMKPQVVEAIINKISILASIDNNTEITLEANPTSFETEKFQAFKTAGVNRVSIGVQSLRENSLKALGRQHDSKQAIQAIKSANAIFSRVSFDLIYARSAQNLKEWQEELQEAMSYSTSHISLYQLTIEKGTPFYKQFREGKLTLPENDVAADMYEWTTNYLKAEGYNRYEISNYAKMDNECLHNLSYWQYQNYLGIGPGAHSRISCSDLISNFLGNCSIIAPDREDKNNINSIMMLHKPENWLKSVEEYGHGIQSFNKLTKKEIIEEFFMMGLRLEKGVKNEDLTRIADSKITDEISLDVANHYSQLGLLNLSNDAMSLTSKGLMLHSYIVPRLLIR